MKYITKKRVRNRTSLLVYKKFFFHALCIKCTFPESASRTAVSVLKLKNEEKREEKYKRNQQAENQLIWFDMLSGVLSPPSGSAKSFLAYWFVKNPNKEKRVTCIYAASPKQPNNNKKKNLQRNKNLSKQRPLVKSPFIKEDHPGAVCAASSCVQKILPRCLPVGVASTRSSTMAIWHYACASVGLSFSSAACIRCLHEDQIYSHECKDEVKCEPEVVVKVTSWGRGGPTLHEQLRWDEWSPYKYTRLECVWVYVYMKYVREHELSWTRHHPCLQSAPWCPSSAWERKERHVLIYPVFMKKWLTACLTGKRTAGGVLATGCGTSSRSSSQSGSERHPLGPSSAPAASGHRRWAAPRRCPSRPETRHSCSDARSPDGRSSTRSACGGKSAEAVAGTGDVVRSRRSSIWMLVDEKMGGV